jgi:hypothetical protein
MGLIQAWAPAITQPQNQFASNVAEAEQFIYGSGPLPALVVGSSMVESIDSLTGGELRVLGMNGMSAREGLQVLLHSADFRRRSPSSSTDSRPRPTTRFSTGSSIL